MTVHKLNYYRVSCDGPSCKARINVAATDGQEGLAAVLRAQTARTPGGAQRSWTKPSILSGDAYCPEHSEESHAILG